jgi:DNA repair exonuclease SbcCD nuclease subunit
MSSMQSTNKEVIAIACADIHLSHLPPIARAKEPSWYRAMARPLVEITKLQERYNNCPVLCAGDIFHHWKSPPELINFAMASINRWIAIPGQHDIPFHNPYNLEKSAFWTLVEADRISVAGLKEQSEEIKYSTCITVDGFAWGVKVSEPYAPCNLNIALVHKYVSVGSRTEYQGAPKEVRIHVNDYEGYTVVIFGDNHIAWDFKEGNTTFWNCGSLMRRNSDQINHKPRVGLIHPDGTVTSHYLDISQDVFTPVEEPKRAEIEGLSDFLSALTNLERSDPDFPAAIRQVLKEKSVSPEVEQILLKAIE